ncbi:arylsulfatase [Dyadobacter jejuensis]|uniref:Arylsulfatase n=1 Tax=Dyadobacter jejuensis TaxID=1082580 RepID=A0A316A7E2_9BACT|nr:sulfatase [Dyadobacter jejuensis]PWJ53369.1 arylsulfatase [Dyadobacter jejuensis]
MNLHNFRTFQFLLLLLASTVNGQGVPPHKEKPNIVLFFIDDLGYGDLSVNGALGYLTPNLDKMAMEGTRFTNFMAAQAVCSASRAALLSGCYPNRLGISGAYGPESKVGLNPEEETIAEVVKKRGYATAIFGKWHLGSRKEFLPLQQGFDEFYGVPYSHDMWPGHPNQAHAQYPPLFWIEGNEKADAIATLSDASALTPNITERAVGFIRKNKSNPFFLYIPHPLPHVPLAASARFRGKSSRGIFGDVLMEIDWSVGQIMQELKAQGLDENTLVIFTSDNGPWLNYGDHAGSTGGFREGKGSSFEGGQRVPCIMRWPGVVPAGRVNNQLMAAMDILPTIASLTGAALPTKKIDGISMAGLIKGEEAISPRKNFLYYYRRNNLEAVRQGDWKLVFEHAGRSYEGQLPGKDGMPGPAPENHLFPKALYHLTRDPGERYDVLEQNPDIVKELEALAEEARTDLGDDLQKRKGKNVRPIGRVE